MGSDRTVFAAGQGHGAAANDGSAGGGERDLVLAAQRLSVASTTERVPAALDRAAIFLWLAGRRHLGADPLFLFNEFGDLERCALRPGNVHSADAWRDELEPVVAQ
jgi:hypothetical protein